MRPRAGLVAALALACGAEEPQPPLPALPAASAPWQIEEARRAAAVVKQIGASEPLALPRLDQRAADPAVAQLFRIPTREFIEACVVNEGWDYVLVCIDPTLTLADVYARAFEREPALGHELFFVQTAVVATLTDLYVELVREDAASAERVARLERMAPRPDFSEQQIRALAEQVKDTDARLRRVAGELRETIERHIVRSLEWIGHEDLAIGTQRELVQRLSQLLGPLRAEKIPLFDGAESCAAIQRAHAAAHDEAVQDELDALARGAQCEARRAT
jgi:hypothetical protein